ncbi:MAG: ACP phosphodiesterase [Candidatus Competibacteraceae bacterium]
MNYLAHLYLADPDPEAWLGSLMGDFAKGAIDSSLPPVIRQNIELHRSIDAFTDTHPIVGASKRRLRPKFRRYGGILVDIFYDHFLADNWIQFARFPLDRFARSVYAVLSAHYDILPVPMRRSVSYMITTDLLPSYRNIAGVERALKGIEGRLKRPSRLSEAVADLHAHYADLRADFNIFFPALVAYVADLKAGFISSDGQRRDAAATLSQRRDAAATFRPANPGQNPLPNANYSPCKDSQ